MFSDIAFGVWLDRDLKKEKKKEEENL